jgi:predicted dehydrogenase
MRGLLLGCGHMGGIHARKLAARDDVTLTIIDPPRGQPDLGGPLPDFAIIATPTTTHAAVALPLLRAGVPCLIEKPLAHSLDDATALARFAHLSVGHVERFNPTLVPIRAAGATPRFLQAERLSPFQRRGTDVDVIADLMIHDIDLALWLLGGPVREVRAVGVGVMTGGADIVSARIELEGGVATLTASRVSHTPARSLRLIEEGTYWSADLRARSLHRVRWGDRKLDPEPVPVPDIDAIEAEQSAFLAAVRGEADYPCPGSEALAALALADQIRRSL